MDFDEYDEPFRRARSLFHGFQEEDTTMYTQRCPIRLFDLDQMKLVNRAWLSEYIFEAVLEASVNQSSHGQELPPKRIERVFRYAILSHRWQKAEINIADIPQLSKGGIIKGKEESHEKLSGFFTAARAAGYRFVWFDSGCIDQDKGPELEESIRSMFSWYRNAHTCFVHLRDTTHITDARADGWFRRGWTLQELLAPKRLVFFDKSWNRLTTMDGQPYDLDRAQYSQVEGTFSVADGTHVAWADSDLCREVVEGSGIGPDNLSSSFEPNADHAPRMFQYLARRATTRLEDMVYCLISLLDVYMPISYGEGLQRAFYRLQVACLQESASRSLLHWNLNGFMNLSSRWNSMLARYPSAFNAGRGYHRRENIYFNIFDASSPVDVSFTINNGGIRIMMCIFDLASPSISQTVKVFDGGLGMNVFMCSFNILGSEISSEDTVLSADRSKFGGEEELKNLVVGVYGWDGDTSYGVLLEKGNAISPSGYARCARGQIEGLPSANAVRESGIQPQWIYIK